MMHVLQQAYEVISMHVAASLDTEMLVRVAFRFVFVSSLLLKLSIRTTVIVIVRKG